MRFDASSLGNIITSLSLKSAIASKSVTFNKQKDLVGIRRSAQSFQWNFFFVEFPSADPASTSRTKLFCTSIVATQSLIGRS